MCNKFTKWLFALICAAFMAVLVVRIRGFYDKQRYSKTWRLSEKQYDESLKSRCFYNSFKRVLLVVNFNFAIYQNIAIVKMLYEGVFLKVVTCGPTPVLPRDRHADIKIDKEGIFGYHCLALAMENYPGYEGYLYSNDDLILNWWTMVELDRDKLWHGAAVVDWSQDATENALNSDWIWWNTKLGKGACQMYYKTLRRLAQSDRTFKAYDVYMRNGHGLPRCGKGWADFFYVPGKMSKDFVRLSHIAYNASLFLEIALHNILRSLAPIADLVVVDGVYLPDKGYYAYTSETFWKFYDHRLAFVHPYKFTAYDEQKDRLLTKIIKFKESLTDCLVR